MGLPNLENESTCHHALTQIAKTSQAFDGTTVAIARYRWERFPWEAAPSHTEKPLAGDIPKLAQRTATALYRNRHL